MRILFLAHRLPYPPNKGDKIRSFWELKTMSRHHEVDLFSFYDDPEDKLQIEKLRPYCRSCYAEPVSRFGSRMRAAFALVEGKPFSTAFYSSTDMSESVTKSVLARAYDLVFVFGSSMVQYASLCPGVPRVVDLVDVDSDKWAQYSDYSRGPLRWLWRLEARRLAVYECAVVRDFSNTLLCTEAEARLLRRKASIGPINVLENWLNLEYYRPEAIVVPEEIRRIQPYLIFTGTMDYFPNVDAVEFFCKDVFPEVRKKIPNLRFVIAGRNPSARVKRLAQDSSVEVTGTVRDIRPYLQAASVAVAPMRMARGVQNKILEALAMDIPVVASSVAASALPQELRSLLVAEREAGALADRIVDYVLSPPERNGARSYSVRRYMDTLDPSSQLDALLGTAVSQAAKADTVGIAV